MDGQLLSRLPSLPFHDAGEAQRALARFNRARLSPGEGVDPTSGESLAMLHLEEWTLQTLGQSIRPFLDGLPAEPSAFVAWFKQLKATGPGQGDPLFPWLSETATLEQLKWFIEQEVAGEAGFEDLLALTQVKMPTRPKLEMARNYWDEMGRGVESGMHGPMLARLSQALALEPQIRTTVPEALTLGNVMIALAANRRYAFHSVGALGVIELTAPTRATYVEAGLRRVGMSRRDAHYFALHAVIDLKHSEAWNSEVIEHLVAENPGRAVAIAEGALLRLWCGLRCFDRYRSEFGVSQ